MLKIMRWTAAVTLFSLLTLLPVPTYAQNSPQNINTTQITGEVVKVDQTSLTIQNSSGVKEYTIPGNVSITRDSFGSSLQDLRPHDRVTLTVDDNGDVISGSATSGPLMDVSKWIIPAGLFTLAVLSLLLYLTRRGQKEFIRTSTLHAHDIREEKEEEEEK